MRRACWSSESSLAKVNTRWTAGEPRVSMGWTKRSTSEHRVNNSEYCVALGQGIPCAGKASYFHHRSEFRPPCHTVSHKCYAAIPRLLRKQLSDLSNVLAEMEARDAQRREQSQATKNKARHGEQPERAGKNCTVLWGLRAVWDVSRLWGKSSPCGLGLQKQLKSLVFALDRCCVRQWMQYVRQNAWPHSGRSGQNRLRRQKKKSRRRKKMTHA